MKKPFYLLIFIFCLIVTEVLSQSFEGSPIIVNLKRKIPVFEWSSLKNNDTTVIGFTTRIIAEIKCEDKIQDVELFVNGSGQKGFNYENTGKNYLVKVDKMITLNEGQNSIYFKVTTPRTNSTSEVRTLTAQRPAKPLITWINPTEIQTTQETSVIKIKACIKSLIPVSKIEIYSNDELVQGLIINENSDKDCAVLVDKNISLRYNENSIYIVAANETGTSTSETKYINYKISANTIKDTSETILRKRIALIIGNSNYQNGGILKNPKNDASDISRALKRLNFDVELVSDADYKQLGMAIDRFGTRVKNADISFFFYAGHGVQVKGANYLIPVDAKIDDENQVKYRCVDANLVLAYMESAESKVNVIVMDACRDNPFERSWNRSTKSQGLASMDAPVGSLVAYSTQPGNTAADGVGSNGLYTSALLQFIEQPGLSLSEIFMKVRVKVLQDSEKKQQPWESSSLTRNVYLLK